MSNENDGWGDLSGWGKPVHDKQSFKLNWDDKDWDVQGIVVGDLAVICGQEPFSILHIHTGGRFDNAIPHGEWAEEELIKWCEKVQDSNSFNWLALKLVSSANDWSNDENVRARGRILDWCRSVKVKE
jgi:hypothetical protein